MKLSANIKPISHLKAHTAEMVRRLTDEREPLVITQNGEAKVVMQDVRSYEETQETLALLNAGQPSNRSGSGRVEPARAVFARLRGAD